MNTPHTFDQYSARDCFLNRRITKSYGEWLAICQRHDSWHEERPLGEVSMEDIALFLDDYCDFKKEA
jgi:hypothetical protein